MDITAIAKQFTDFYYSIFDTAAERGKLVTLYRPSSMLSWEGTPITGVTDVDGQQVSAIIHKLTSFPPVTHDVANMIIDAQPSSLDPNVPNLIVSVTGNLSIEGGPPLKFSQVFQLISEAGSYYVYNDIFRLNIG